MRGTQNRGVDATARVHFSLTTIREANKTSFTEIIRPSASRWYVCVPSYVKSPEA